YFFFFFNDTATTEIYTLSLHDALPIWLADHAGADIPPSERERLLRLAGHSRKTFLGPREKVKGAIGYDSTWRLFVNLTQEELRGSAGLGRRRTIKKEM